MMREYPDCTRARASRRAPILLAIAAAALLFQNRGAPASARFSFSLAVQPDKVELAAAMHELSLSLVVSR
jgi:hypothetical protein